MSEIDNFDLNPENLEAALSEIEVDDIQDFSTAVDFEKYIVLSKKELVNFCRIVEPLTKASIDDYGKSVFVTCIDCETVELKYYNNPYVITAQVSNKSGKVVKDFAILVSTLKRLLGNAFSSLVLVEQNDEMNLAFGEQLIYLETKPLRSEVYNFTKKSANNLIDKELALYTFKKVGAILSQTERASEKVVVVKDGKVNFNTGVFASKTKSPFSGDEAMVVYKQVADVIAALSEISKAQLKYELKGNILVLDADGTIYCELPAGVGDKVNDFLSPSAAIALKFDANIEIINDTLLRLVALVKSLDYLSDVVKLGFTKEAMTFELAVANHSKTFPYTFTITAGAPEFVGEMNLTVDVLRIFLDIVGKDVKYSFTENGLGIQNDCGSFLIRRS